MPMAKAIRAGITLLAVALVVTASGCGGGDGGEDGGGHCLSSQWCWQVTDPPDYRIDQMCALSGSTWHEGSCDASAYERRCTQDTSVSVNGGPAMTVRYVYYFPPGSSPACLGDEEILP
jgi:hypothetical protein